MSFQDVVRERYSYRGFQNRAVEEDKIRHILECARLAPSAANRQPWKIYLVSDAGVREKLYEAYDRDWFREAPLVVVFTGISGSNWVRKDGFDYLLCDVSLVADHFVLAASEAGLGTCYIAAFDEEKVRSALSLPGEEIPYLLTPLGYPKPDARREKKRKEMDEIVIRV